VVKGRGNFGQGRTTALAFVALAATALGLPFAAIAEDREQSAFVESQLLATAARKPDALFRVIVQGTDGASTADVADEVVDRLDDNARAADELTGRFQTITGVSATLTGYQVLDLSRDGAVDAITQDVPMVSSADMEENAAGSNGWLQETGILSALRTTAALRARPPTIAIVDSGLTLRKEFSGQVVAQVSLTQLTPNASGDGRGHGTFVAGLASRAAPTGKLVAIDVMDDSGRAMTSDVIAAADWILQNKDRYRVRVANFSLHAARPSSFLNDPLDRAVERLWHAGVVVVASAGNYGSERGASGVLFAPANDPFVITVGAADLGSAPGGADDSNAPWSAHGRTPDGFLKPDLGAPGRRLIGPVSPGATMALEHPERVVARGYMRMSGTSFAAPIVAGAAAQVFAVHPEWTPDQVKGALMASARAVGQATEQSLGVGQIDALAAQRIVRPPNPNRALTRFLIDDPAGGSIPVFDAASWDSASTADASWDSASWIDASWADASWADASWTDASWTDASWADASWADASWADVSWVG
jgi:serine protease AprX